MNYSNTEIKMKGPIKIIRKVTIKNNKGTKSIAKYRGEKKINYVRKLINDEHVKMIKKGKFVKGLFDDCIDCKKNIKNNKK